MAVYYTGQPTKRFLCLSKRRWDLLEYVAIHNAIPHVYNSDGYVDGVFPAWALWESAKDLIHDYDGCFQGSEPYNHYKDRNAEILGTSNFSQ